MRFCSQRPVADFLNKSSCLAAAFGVTRGGLVERLSPAQVVQQCVTKFKSLTIMNLITPKVGAKHKSDLDVQQIGLRG